nr:hypothetical protein 3 [Gammaproteobacteria bacterium]
MIPYYEAMMCCSTQYHELINKPQPKLFKVFVYDQYGDQFHLEIGGVDFDEASFASKEEAEREFDAAVDRHTRRFRLYKPVRAEIMQRVSHTRISEETVTTTKLKNHR